MEQERHAEKIEGLRRAILMTPGETSERLRGAAAAGEPTGTPADDYLRKLRSESYRIVDDDLDQMRQGGLSEDVIFELTLAAAFGEASRRFEAAIAAMRSDEDDGAP